MFVSVLSLSLDGASRYGCQQTHLIFHICFPICHIIEAYQNLGQCNLHPEFLNRIFFNLCQYQLI